MNCEIDYKLVGQLEFHKLRRQAHVTALRLCVAREIARSPPDEALGLMPATEVN
jgi:hypothetical protein